MPEAFMLDESVPIKWRLYGYINGFWIAGKPVYATNSHFAERFKCSERHVSRALEELEKEGLLARDIEGFKRYILPGGMTPQVRGGRRGRSAEGDVGGQHISDSNSDNIKGVAPLRIESETPKKDKTYSEVFELFSTRKQPWMTYKAQIEAAKRLKANRGIPQIRGALFFYKEHLGEKFLPQIDTPFDLEAKWTKLFHFKENL